MKREMSVALVVFLVFFDSAGRFPQGANYGSKSETSAHSN